jgi:hypothetical protein
MPTEDEIKYARRFGPEPDDPRWMRALTVGTDSHADLAHAMRRMLQALDAYWELTEKGRAPYRRDSVSARFFRRYVRYRARVEAILNA